VNILKVRNVQEALPKALRLLDQIGVKRSSRYGDVLYGGSVTTIYTHPDEKVLFWSARDANPFLHLYESLWMLAGRRDINPLVRYAKKMLEFSDDGIYQHAAYGHRWRRHFHDAQDGYKIDQLATIIDILKRNPDDRRCVLQMWDPTVDLGKSGKDFPCNTAATFQRGLQGELNMTVFCRSNDIVWGAYGANAVQFGTLLEYMALGIGCAVGTYTQISINWHGYLATLAQVDSLRPDLMGFVNDPYKSGHVHFIPMETSGDLAQVDEDILMLLEEADTGFQGDDLIESNTWTGMVWCFLKAHHVWKTTPGRERYQNSVAVLDLFRDQKVDWIVAAREWLHRRMSKAILAGELTHP
jgi:hypothetical protein